jgi:hypothetical protein
LQTKDLASVFKSCGLGVVLDLLEDASGMFPILLFSEFSVKVVRHRVRLWKRKGFAKISQKQAPESL